MEKHIGYTSGWWSARQKKSVLYLYASIDKCTWKRIFSTPFNFKHEQKYNTRKSQWLVKKDIEDGDKKIPYIFKILHIFYSYKEVKLNTLYFRYGLLQ